MSSAILYVAIVAIWAGVLIPRWLRRDSSAQEREDDEVGPAETEAVPSAVPAPLAPTAHEPAPRSREDAVPPAPSAERQAPAARTAPGSRPVAAERQVAASRQAPPARPGPADRRVQAPQAGPAERAAPADGRPGAPAGEELTEERGKVLAARRRMLGMLVILALGSAALAVTKMAAWWVVMPPFVMLTGYVALLREASKADAERRELARARAAVAAADRVAPPVTTTGTMPAAGAAAAAAPAAPVTPAPLPVPGVPAVPEAEVIDISASLGEGGEEFYDQYADAKLRAVGDLARLAAV